MKLSWIALVSVVPACVEPRVSARTLPMPPIEAQPTPVLQPAHTQSGQSAPGPLPPDQPTPTGAPGSSHGASSPLSVAWVAGQVSDTRAVLRARVVLRSRVMIPLTLHVSVPPGVRMLRGADSLPLPATTQQEVLEYEYEFAYTSMPTDDIMLAVDGDTDSMGVHARAAYRFGRPAPEGPRPQPSGPPLVIGGRNFGSPINAAP